MYNSLHIEDFIKKNTNIIQSINAKFDKPLTIYNIVIVYILTYKVVIPREKVAMTLYRVDLFFLCLIMSIYAKKKINKVISTKEQSKNRATLF